MPNSCELCVVSLVFSFAPNLDALCRNWVHFVSPFFFVYCWLQQLVHADIFRPPSKYPMLFCVLVGTGVQLLCMGLVTIGFAAVG